MEMDWNWFFSALAQSTAAIVGLIGAFVFTRIVRSEGESKRDRERGTRLLNEARQLADRDILIPFQRFNEYWQEHSLNSLNRWLFEQDEVKSPEEFYDIMPWSQFVPVDEVLPRIKEVIEKYEEGELRKKGGSTRIKHFDVFGRDRGEEASREMANILRRQTRHDVDERVQSYCREVRHHAKVVEKYVSRMEGQPHYSKLINRVLIVLFLLFLSGVAYPLGFLPAVESPNLKLSPGAVPSTLISVKGGLVVLVTVLFLIIVYVLYQMNRGLRVKHEELTQLRPFTDPAYYSHWISNEISNRQWLKENLDERW